MDQRQQLVTAVAAVVADPLVELAVQALERRHPQHQLPARSQRLVEIAECSMVVGDVFEDVQQDSGGVGARGDRSIELCRDYDDVGMVLQSLA